MAEKHIELNSPHPDWHSEDAANLRNFFRTKTGAKLLGMVAQLRPIVNSTTVEAVALEAKIAAGWEQCQDLLLRAGMLKVQPDEIEHVKYPDLDNSEGWSAELQAKPEEGVEPAVLTELPAIEKLD